MPVLLVRGGVREVLLGETKGGIKVPQGETEGVKVEAVPLYGAKTVLEDTEKVKDGETDEVFVRQR